MSRRDDSQGGPGGSLKPVTAWVKALPLSSHADVEKIKGELEAGNVLIVKITPLALKSIEEVKEAIDDIKAHVEAVGGDIARLGDERIVVTPPTIKIWRKKGAEGLG